MTLDFPNPPEINGEQLTAELAAAGAPWCVVFMEEGVLYVGSPALTEDDRAGVGAVLAAHVPAPSRLVTKEAFLARFSMAERVSISTSPAPAAVETRNMLYTHPRPEVDVDSEKVINGLAGLVAAGLLGADRPEQIRAGESPA